MAVRVIFVQTPSTHAPNHSTCSTPATFDLKRISPLDVLTLTTTSVKPASFASFKSRAIFSLLLAKSLKLADVSIQIKRGLSLFDEGGSGNIYSGSLSSVHDKEKTMQPNKRTDIRYFKKLLFTIILLLIINIVTNI